VSAEELEAHPPRGFVCNSPNPFNPSTTIRFSIATQASDVVSVDIYNSKGQKVQELVTQMEAGLGSVHWDGDDATGKPVSSGVYFCRIQADTTTLTHKMVMMK
jgi:flagellar hook assembly protein FlgD